MRYSDLIQEHFRTPRRAGPLRDATHRATGENPVCGDVLSLDLRIENGHIAQAAFQAEGCVPTHAMGSLLAERLSGMALAEAGSLSLEDMLALIGPLPPGKEHVAHLALSVLRGALRSPCAR